MDLINKYAKIIDKKTGECLAQGEVKFDKNAWGGKNKCYALKSDLISFDNLVFFHSVDYDRCPYIIEISQDPLEYKSIDFYTSNKFRKKLYRLLDLNEFYSFDVYLEKRIDSEIQTLCDILNSVQGIETMSSCCGHNMIHAYITIKVLNLVVGEKFLNILYNVNGELYNHWHSEFRSGYSVDLSSNIDYIKHMGIFIPITLVANYVGYEPINILSRELQKYIELGYFN